MSKRVCKPWTTVEIARLRRAWPDKPHDEIKRMFPERTADALRRKASELKMRRLNGRRDWNRITAEYKPVFNFMAGVIR